MTRVAIHTYPGLPLAPDSLLSQLLPRWREAGLTVELRIGPRTAAPARVGILHVDLTRVPDPYVALARAYPVLLNGGVVDIAKRLFANSRVRRDDAFDGPVIVKTELNCRGIPERLAARRARTWPGLLWSSALDHLFPTRPGGRLWHKSYPMFANKAAVPNWVWHRCDLFVQRFVTERGARGYAQRHWIFVGDESYHLIRHASSPMFERDGDRLGPARGGARRATRAA